LLFNEGYNSTHPVRLICRDLCAEAMRLGLLLSKHPCTSPPAGSALLALVCFQATRFDARTDALGAIVLLADQGHTQWDQELIQKGSCT
jgi:RNA polymerase sigma-70 factor (ECF subfamily)